MTCRGGCRCHFASIISEQLSIGLTCSSGPGHGRGGEGTRAGPGPLESKASLFAVAPSLPQPGSWPSHTAVQALTAPSPHSCEVTVRGGGHGGSGVHRTWVFSLENPGGATSPCRRQASPGVVCRELTWARAGSGGLGCQNGGDSGGLLGRGRDWSMRVLAPLPASVTESHLDLIYVLEFRMRLKKKVWVFFFHFPAPPWELVGRPFSPRVHPSAHPPSPEPQAPGTSGPESSTCCGLRT